MSLTRKDRVLFLGATGGGAGPVESITGTAGQITVTGTTTPILSLPTAVTGVNSITSAAANPLTLSTATSGQNVVITPNGYDALGGSYTYFGQGPENNYFAPIRWGRGSGFAIFGGTTLFSGSGFTDVPDYLGSFGYNQQAAVGDVAVRLNIEHGFQVSATSRQSEMHFSWDSADNPRTVSRRLFQANIDWGEEGGGSGSGEGARGFSKWSFNVNKFSVGSTAVYDDKFLLDFTTSPISMRWIGIFMPDAMGTTSEAFQLPMRGSSYAQLRFQNATTGYTGSDGIEFSTGDGTADFYIRNNEAAGHLQFFTNGLNERARITAGGRFLVGATTDSGDLFQVTGAATLRGNLTVLSTSTNPQIRIFESTSTQTAQIETFNGDLYISTTGNKSTIFRSNASTTTATLTSAGALTLASSITTSAPNTGTAGAWKLGIRVAATVAFDTTQYVQLDVGGTLYKLAIAT